MGTAVEDSRLAPFVIGLVRRQRRQYQLGLVVGGGVLLVALVAAAASGAGWGVLVPSGGGAMVLGTIALRLALQRRSDDSAVAANRDLLAGPSDDEAATGQSS